MTSNQDTLRIAFKAFYRMAHGAKFSQGQLKTLADLCALSLPMKYRFSREELDQLINPKPKSEAGQ